MCPIVSNEVHTGTSLGNIRLSAWSIIKLFLKYSAIEGLEDLTRGLVLIAKMQYMRSNFRVSKDKLL